MSVLINEDFILQSAAARELYHGFAEGEPILDFHNHLPPDEIASDRSFADMQEVWLAGDHYKWRAMRANGTAERFCTGDASPREKFDAWAATVPHAMGNPLYHWTHLELSRYFGIDELFSPQTADKVWEVGNAKLAQPEFSTRGLLKKMKVRALCTTDDPVDSLEYHAAIRDDASCEVKVYPTFRPDVALRVDDAEIFNSWADKLSQVSGVDCSSLRGFKAAIRKQHDFFHEMGGRISDHGLYRIFDAECSEADADKIFANTRGGKSAGVAETEKFGNYLMLFFGELDAAAGWTKQLHIGCERNNSTKMFEKLGRDVGCDSMADADHAQALRHYLDALQQRDALPKMIIYPLNPVNNYSLATMLGNFQGGDGNEGEPPCRLQLGTSWWFMDCKDGMEEQMKVFANTSLFSHFVGMLTDSRSFLSFTRHEYFRRILCNQLGTGMESGDLPRDMDLIGGMVKRICFGNAERFFGLDV